MDKNSFLISLSESEQTDCGRIDFDQQSEPQKVFSAIWALESQINNGGFAQYFESFDGETANFAPAALRAIEAHKCADIVQRALRAVSTDALPASAEDRERILGGLPETAREELDALDQEFFAYPDNLTELLFAYVAARRDTFGRIPE